MPPLEIAASQWNEPLTLDLDSCKDLMRFEMAFTRLLQIKQRPDIYEPGYYFKTADGILKNPKNSPPPPKAGKPGQPQAVNTEEHIRAKLAAAQHNHQQQQRQQQQPQQAAAKSKTSTSTTDKHA